LVGSSGVVSVVIVNFKGVDDTIECIERLEEVEWPKEALEIVVVENGSRDGSYEKLRGLGDRITLVKSDENLGFTGGSNLGARKARGEFVAFLNNDSKPDTKWIEEGIRPFRTSQRIAAVASKVLDWDGKAIDFVGGELTWYGMGFKSHVTEIDTGAYDNPRDVLFGTGSALFVRADVFADVGGFDERLFMFYDDVDLGWRLNLLGYRVRYAPESVVYHKHHGSMRSFGAYREMYLLERNALITLYKNLDDAHLAKFLPGALALAVRRSVTKSGMDSSQFDIRAFSNAPDEFDPAVPVNKEALSGVFAIDQFVDLLPDLATERARIQAERTVRDETLFSLFGDMANPLYHEPRHVDGLRRIMSTFDIEAPDRQVRVLVITGDSIGTKMAGPAIRAWNIAEHLSSRCEVRLVTWNVANRPSSSFEVFHVDVNDNAGMHVHEKWADVILVQGYALHHYHCLSVTKKILVADLYDPMHLEQLEQGRDHGLDRWQAQISSATEVLNEQIAKADFFLCASEKQRAFWLGQLAGMGRVNALTYEADHSLEDLIAVVPFGLESQVPVQTRHAIKGAVPGIGPDDKVIVWGGGIYNWFDTATLIRAMRIVADDHPDAKLFFLGVAHPNPDVPEMAIVTKTRRLADELDLTDKNVFFNREWVALDDRHNYLLDADAGVSTHYEHVETMFSFRTRILDYLWAKLPMVTTRGDSFAELIDGAPVGITVPELDADALAAAIVRVLYDLDFREIVLEQLSTVREDFTWERVLEPVLRFATHPEKAPDHASAVGRKPAKQRLTAPSMDAVRVMPPGVRRDVQLMRYYLRNEGVSGLARRVSERIKRQG
jgi:GT2 family glycosyltransferase/glycosyltransferase involved in cell wall biosynthesis